MYGQYRQMSGGRFLVSAKDVMYSENILKLKSLVQEGINIDDSLKVEDDVTEDITELLTILEGQLGDVDGLRLFQECREVSDHIAGHIAHKSRKICAGCCDDELISRDTANTEGEYVSVLSRGGLLIPSPGLSDAVARGFALLDASTDVIRISKVPS